jgi:DNA-binding MarR family transcriptional regulator
MPKTDVPGSASELRIVLGGLIRRLRVENSFPIAQGSVLSRLDREGPTTTSALAAAEGLIASRPHPIDRRKILIELTADGAEKLAEDRRRREGWLARAIATTLTSEEQTTLALAVPLLRRLTEA